MPTTSQDGQLADSSKKVDRGEKESKNDKQDTETSKNGNDTADGENKGQDVDVKESNETVDKEQLANEATTLLALGKRHLYVKDYPSAVTALGDACGKFSELYGEIADECAEAYFSYGCALLELAREESGVLDVDNKDKESEEDEENEEEAEATDSGKKITESEAEETNADSDEKQGKSSDEQTEGEGNADGEGKEEDEDVNNLQLAWEMFELAKVIFIRLNEDKKLAETYLRLGEVALESENYGTAITDIQSCLDLQKKILPPVSREIAETLFQLGVACSLCNQFDDAIKHFTSAGVLLEKRIHNLSAMSDPEPEKAKNPFYSLSSEIEELKALLPEIKDKISDMEEFKNETMKAVVQATINNTAKDTTDGAGPSTNGASVGSSSLSGTLVSSSSSKSKAPVNDISHLVRKKRKNPEDANEVSNVECKKPNSESKTT